MISISSPGPLKRVWHFIRSLFLSLILIIPTSGIVQAETYKVIRVYDGGTITILKEGKIQSIRLIGTDTPEKSSKKGEPGQPYSKKATKFLAGYIFTNNNQTE